MAKKQISKSGAAKLREELDYLVTVRRAEMAQKLKEARAQGDLSENAEYDEAKNEQAIMEAQIMEIQYTLDNSEIVDDNASIDEVGLGSTIKIKNFRTGKIETLQIVSSNEANFKEGKISDESPIGKGAMKKKVGDNFLIDNPISRYCVNDRSGLHRNADGSVDVTLSKDAPEDTTNWLPVSDEKFHLFLRIYKPDWTALDSFPPPVISVK